MQMGTEKMIKVSIHFQTTSCMYDTVMCSPRGRRYDITCCKMMMRDGGVLGHWVIWTLTLIVSKISGNGCQVRSVCIVC